MPRPCSTKILAGARNIACPSRCVLRRRKSVRAQSQQGGTLGTTSLKSSKTMRPAGLPSMAQSKKTFGLPAAAAKGRAHAGENRARSRHESDPRTAAGDSARPRADPSAALARRAVRESTCRGGKHSGAGAAACKARSRRLRTRAGGAHFSGPCARVSHLTARARMRGTEEPLLTRPRAGALRRVRARREDRPSAAIATDVLRRSSCDKDLAGRGGRG